MVQAFGSRQRALAMALLLMVSGPALAESSAVEFFGDGRVRAGGHLFASQRDFNTSTFFRDSGLRCGTVVPAPVALAGPTDCSLDATVINASYNDGRTLIIPVVFHVVTNTAGQGTLSEAAIKSQIAILNEDFNAVAGTPGAPGFNAKIKFVLARVDPNGRPTNGIEVIANNAYFTADADNGGPMKTALRWDPARYFNIYTSQPGGGVLGYATFPAENAGRPIDGVVLLWQTVGRNSGNPPYDQGRTATHEVGHYLGLYHTFQTDVQNECPNGGGYVSGDLIADTNRHGSPNFGCTASTDCTPALPTPITNYMNYTDDTCMNRFSTEQSNRMRCSIFNYRQAFLNTEPKADFTFVAADKAVTFTNASTDAESALNLLRSNWSFGDGMTSTEASPVHTYAADGMYNVTLEIIDPGSGVSTTMKQLVVVTQPAPPDAGGGGGGDDGGGAAAGGCCQAPNGDTTFILCAIPVVLVLRRRRGA